MDKYGERFSLEELRAHLEVEMKQSRSSDQDAVRGILMLAQSNYEVQFHPQQASSPSRVKSRTPVTRRRSSSGNFLSWD